MKKLLILLVLLILCVSAAPAEVVRKGDLICAAVEARFEGWREIGHSTYGSGKWEDEMAHYCAVYLLRVADGQLLLRNLHVIMNPIEPGDPVPWEVTDFAPVSLTTEAEARLAAMSPGEIVEGCTRELAAAFGGIGPTEYEDYLRPLRDFGEDDWDTYVPGEE